MRTLWLTCAMLGCGAAPTPASPQTVVVVPATLSSATPTTAALPSAPATAEMAEMVDVPGAELVMGNDGGPKSERPAHRVTVAAFKIDRLETTVEEYAACVKEGRCREGAAGEYCNWGKPDRLKHPINCVSWNDAVTYCEFRGKRLLREAEWELAARGTDGRAYPWGTEEPRERHLCWARLDSKDGTCAVGEHPKGASPYGAEDMAGNVWEWVQDPHCKYAEPSCKTGERTGRGGSWDYTNPENVSATTRAGAPADARRDLIGIRCGATP